MKYEFSGNVHHDGVKYSKGDDVPNEILEKMQAIGVVHMVPSDAERADMKLEAKKTQVHVEAPKPQIKKGKQ